MLIFIKKKKLAKNLHYWLTVENAILLETLFITFSVTLGTYNRQYLVEIIHFLREKD
jgi:hypothetical protein